MTLDAFFPTPGKVLTVAIGQMPLSHSVWEPPLCDTVMSMCPHCDSVDSRGGLDGGSQERKAQEDILRCLPGAVLSGLSDGWGGLSTQKEGQDGLKMAERTLE